MNTIKKEVAVVTGAGGTLCSALAIELGQKGYDVVLMGRSMDKLLKTEQTIKAAGGNAFSVACDVRNLEEVRKAHDLINKTLGPCSILINGAGGNQAEAVTSVNEFDARELQEEPNSLRGFFNLDMKRFLDVIDVNVMGTVIPCQVFAPDMARAGKGCIINFASMNTYRPLSKVPAYALSKAGIANFTQWLAAYLAPAHIRVNAIAPGFFLNDRSRKLLLTADGGCTERGSSILRQTPMKHFGEASELVGCMNWLIDEKASGFVTGITIPIDGGFLACSGI